MSENNTAGERKESLKLYVNNGIEIMRRANNILKQNAPNVPDVSSPGRGALVVALFHAWKHADQSNWNNNLADYLDYRQYEDRWQTIDGGNTSMTPADFLGFSLVANESSYIEFKPGIHPLDNLPALYGAFRESPYCAKELPKGISPVYFNRIFKVSLSLQEPWSTSELKDAYKQQFGETLGATSTKIFCRYLVKQNKLKKTGKSKNTRYQHQITLTTV